MAEFETVRRAGAGVRSAEIDEGLRAHMNRVYGLMSLGHGYHWFDGVGHRWSGNHNRPDTIRRSHAWPTGQRAQC